MTIQYRHKKYGKSIKLSKDVHGADAARVFSEAAKMTRERVAARAFNMEFDSWKAVFGEGALDEYLEPDPLQKAVDDVVREVKGVG